MTKVSVVAAIRWLNGDLQISAKEQIAFLRKLHDYSVPFRREHVDIVKKIMLDEQSADYIISAKIGWTGAKLQVGWYVGYVEKGGANIYTQCMAAFCAETDD